MNEYLSICSQQLKKCWKWYKGFYQGRAWYVKTLATLATLVVLFFAYLGMVDINFLWLFGKSPSMSDVRNTHPAEASYIYSADGKMIGKFFSENRTPVVYDEVSSDFWNALIDTEDERFYRHHGIDYQAFAAALKDYVMHRDARGASTITQQLAKNLFRVRTQYSTGLLGNIPGLKMLIMKSKEWITAYKLEWFFSKEEILTMYANTVDFGSNAFGIKTACKTYFGSATPKTLAPEQAAVLVGLLKATTYYNPRINPKNALARRNVVLDNMRKRGHLTQQQFDTLKLRDIKLDYSVENAYDGDANYFREAVGDWLKDWCRDYYGEDRAYAYYTEGLKIHTTLDSRMQQYAEDAAIKQMKQVQKTFNQHWGNVNPWQDERHIEIPHFIEDLAKKTPYYKLLSQKFNGNQDSIDHYLNLPHPVKLFDYEQGFIEREMSTLDSIRYMEHFMHCGFVAIEPQTGHVKAWVGDVDFHTWKYDKVTAMRQPGSTFKLFVYAEAMNQGITPCETRPDEYFSMKVMDHGKEVTWAPTNADGHFSGMNITLKQAFAMSINSVAVRLGQECGIDNIVNTAHAMGIKSKLDPTPSLTLGASDVNLLELVGAYCTPCNDGKAITPILVTKIEDREGNVIYEAKPDEREALSLKSAFYVQQLLRGGMSGTSSRLMGFVGYDKAADTDFGGKTGTSNNHSDAWFIGTTPRLVCGAWVGGEYRCIHFRTGQLGQGNRTALPICGYFLQSVLSDKRFHHYRTKFKTPEQLGLHGSDYDCGGYFMAPSDSDSLAVDSLGVTLDDGTYIQSDPSSLPHQPVPDNASQYTQPSAPLESEEPKE
ncbi:MAG: transglycosylase domain-containing protein [Prevotella sp.]|nr:transglycosylase domain-containing protein [Prevotella sp.]